MLTIQTVQNIKKGSRLTFANGVYAIVLGILYMVFLRFILTTDLRKISVVWEVFSKYNPDISAMFIRLMIMKGIFLIAIGGIIIYLSLYILKKKDKNAWFVLFIVGVLFWASLLANEVLDKNIYTIIATLIGWVMFVIGMLLPIKYYLRNDQDDY